MNTAIIDVEHRDIEVVTGEINTLATQFRTLTLGYAVEIGRRLVEAKSLLGHGEWGAWIEEKVPFSQRTANNLMRVFEEYGSDQITLFGAVPNSQALANLSLTKAFRLLSLPEEEREDFVSAHDVEAMSTRELEEAIAARKHAEEDARILGAKLDEMKALADKKEKQKLDLAKALDAAKKAAESAQKQAAATVEKGLKDAKEETRRALEERAAAIDEKHALEEELAELKNAAKMADPDVAGFKVLFERVQTDVAGLWTIITRIDERDQGTAEKLSRAMTALAGKIGGVDG